MICPYCGSDNKESAKFCKNCGKSLNPVSTMKKEYLDSHNKQQPINTETANTSSIFSSKNLIIICVTIIVCIGLVMGSALYISSNNNPTNANNNSNSNNNENITDNSTNQTTDNNNEDTVNTTKTDTTTDTTVTKTVTNYDNIRILSGKFYTGNKLSDKTYCDVYVGSENVGTKLKIQIYYSRNGKTLNPGNIVPKTVDGDGYVSLRSANAFKYYPDYASITLYDLEGNVLDTKDVKMSATKGTQTF